MAFLCSQCLFAFAGAGLRENLVIASVLAWGLGDAAAALVGSVLDNTILRVNLLKDAKC